MRNAIARITSAPATRRRRVVMITTTVVPHKRIDAAKTSERHAIGNIALGRPSGAPYSSRHATYAAPHSIANRTAMTKPAISGRSFGGRGGRRAPRPPTAAKGTPSILHHGVFAYGPSKTRSPLRNTLKTRP